MDEVALNYAAVDLNLHSVFDLPLYLTTGTYTEPSGTGKVTWESSNVGTATINADGRVHPVAVGTTTITGTHADFLSKPATCEVTVYEENTCTTFFYVSPVGDDANNGSEVAPFKNVTCARDAIRALGTVPAGGVTVILEDGKYPTPETLVFEPQDSGKRDDPIVYRARNQGKAIITGEVPITGWKKAQDVAGLPEGAADSVYVADVSPGWRFHDMYVDGERQQVSRSFNTDSWREWPIFYGRAPIQYDAEKGTRVLFDKGELDGLDGQQDVELVLLPVMYWNSIPLVKHIDSASRTAYLQSKIPSNFWPTSFGTNEGYYNILNTLKYLDEPGEWCVDSAAGKVYFWPKDENTIDNASIVAPKPYELIRLQGDGVNANFNNLVEHLTFDGISFQYTDRLPENEFPDDWVIRNAENPDAAIYLDGAKNCRIINSEVAHSGTYGITINHYGQNNQIMNNSLHDLGSGGVQIFGYGVGTVDVSYNNIVVFNTIFNMGVAPYQHSPGIGVFGSGMNTFAYNYIAGAPYAGISIVGTDENSISAVKPDTRAAYDLFGKQSSQYGIRFADLEALPDEEKDGINGEYFSIGRLAEKYQHSSRNVVEYNILDDYSESMDDGGALYSWYSGLGNVYAYNVLKEQLEGARTWVFRLYMDDRALGFTLLNNYCTGNFDATIDKSFNPYKNRWLDNNYAKYPALPDGYEAQRQLILDTVNSAVGGYNLPESVTPNIITPADGEIAAAIPTTFTWNKCKNASKYTLEIAKDLDFSDIVESIQTRSTVLTIEDLEYKTDYFARLSTREYLQEPKTSPTISFATGKQQKPSTAPQGITISNDIDAVLIQWTPIAKTNVNVYRKAKNEDDYTLVGENTVGRGYLDSQVQEKETYSYKISAVNPEGEGPHSDVRSITTRKLEILFRDNFDDGTISDLWTDINGKQVNLIAEDAKVTDKQWEPAGSWLEYYVGVGREDWNDYAVEADITFKGLQNGAESYSGFGLITRANNNGGKQFYEFIIRTKEKKMEFLRCDKNVWHTYATIATDGLPVDGTTYRMRAENVGDSVRIYLNGVLFTETEEGTYKSGGIGFGYGKENIAIDNVRVVQPKQYSVAIDKGIIGGTLTADYSKAVEGQGISITATADEGYKFLEGSLTLNGKALDNAIFDMPDKDVVLGAKFVAITTDLEKSILSAEKLANDVTYTADSRKNVANAIAGAKALLVKPAVTPAEIKVAIQALNEAVVGLKKVADTSSSSSPQSNSEVASSSQAPQPPKPIKVAKVTLNMLSKDLKVKQSVQLKATVTPANSANKTVTWKSSNTKVATVSKTGMVTAIKSGKATIIATVDGKTVKASIRVGSSSVAVSSVKLSSSKLALNVKGSATLKATVNPAKASNKKVVWASSNAAVASVSSSGKVTAKSVGKATITATSNEGGKLAKCTVTVKAAVTSVKISKTAITLKPGKTTTLKLTVAPKAASGTTVTWKTSNAKVASVSSSGKVKAIAKGSTTITAVVGNKTVKSKISVK